MAPTARATVSKALADRPAWVRINAVGTPWCESDLEAVGELASGIRIPKTESAADVEWVSRRAPGKPLICAIESARGVFGAQKIAAGPGVRHLAMGGVDLQRDLNASNGNAQTLYVIPPRHRLPRRRDRPSIDSVYPKLDDADGLLEQALFARSLGFFGKSAIHPCQLAAIHEVFTPSAPDIAWARKVLAAFDASGGEAVRLSTGEFIDLPVAQRARHLLKMAESGSRRTSTSSQ